MNSCLTRTPPTIFFPTTNSLIVAMACYFRSARRVCRSVRRADIRRMVQHQSTPYPRCECRIRYVWLQPEQRHRLLIAIISHPTVTDKLLRKLARSPNRLIRIAVAKHVKKLWLLQDLLSDTDKQVRNIVSARLREQ